MVNLPVQERIGDVQGVQLQVLNGCQGKNGTQSSPTRSGGKHLAKVQAWTLGEALCNQTRLVAVN